MILFVCSFLKSSEIHLHFQETNDKFHLFIGLNIS